ncbi:MAG: hypothetical protein JWP75_1968 [Frondihabitans sp.]|nr:hypothetical protein [Frondihabitans sp.]
MSTSTSLSQSPNRLLGIVVGIIFLLIGLLGFFIATPYPFATPQGGVLIGLFASNALLASIHVVIGGFLLICALAARLPAKIVNFIVGIGLFAFGVFGLFASDTSANIFAINSADTVLHFLAGLLLAVAALATDKVLFQPKTA